MQSATMNAVTLQGPGDLQTQRLPVPSVRRGGVRIRVEAAGICGTDVLVYQGKYAAALPLVIGHEFAGVVEQIGADVPGLRKGDRVAVEASWGCGICLICQRGETSLCHARVSLGRTRSGCFAEYVVVPARAVHKLPASVSVLQAQALVTIACAIRALRRGRPEVGERVAIFGPGVSGLTLLQLVLRTGAAQVVFFGTRESRLALARELGAAATLSVHRADWAEQARELTSGRGFDLVFEVSGSRDALSQAIEVAGHGGRIVAFSIYDGPIDGFPAEALYAKEVTIAGTRGGAGGYAPGLDLLARGQIAMEPLISHQLSLKEAKKGFDLIEGRDEDVLRVVLAP